MTFLKNLSLKKITKFVVVYLFLFGILTATFFSFNSYIYKTDEYTGKNDIQLNTDFNTSYEFLIEVDSKPGVHNEISDIADVMQENLNYLGFQDALVNVESENLFRVTIPLLDDYENLYQTNAEEAVQSLNILFTGSTTISFYDSNGVSLFDEYGNFNSNSNPIYFQSLPTMIKPGSAYVESSGGNNSIVFTPSRGDDGKNAFTEAFTFLGNNTSEGEASSDGSSESGSTNAMYVWINYDKIYSFISYVDPEGLSSAGGDLYSYCLPTNVSGEPIFSGTFKEICQPYLITVQIMSPLVNPNFEEVQLTGPIDTGGGTGSFSLELANYFVNQINESAKGYETLVVYSGWVESQYSPNLINWILLVFAILILIYLIIVISYYGLSGTIVAFITTSIYMLLFVVLFSAAIQFSFAITSAVFIFTIINSIIMMQILSKYKSNLKETRKESKKEFINSIKSSFSLLSIFSLVFMLIGFVSYTFGYQQIAIIGIISFLSSSLLIVMIILFFIPLMYYLLINMDEKSKLLEGNYNFILGVNRKSKNNKSSAGFLDKERMNKDWNVKFSVIISFLFTASFILYYVLTGAFNIQSVNTSLQLGVNSYRYDLVSDNEFNSNEDISELGFLPSEEVNNVVSVFEDYVELEYYEKTIIEYNSESYEDILLNGGPTNFYVIKVPSISIYTKEKISDDDMSTILTELNNDDFIVDSIDYSYELYLSEPTYNSSYSSEYLVNNSFKIIGISLLVLLFIYLIVGKWTGLFVGIWSVVMQTLMTFGLMFIFYVPFSQYIAFALLFSFFISSFTKLLFFYNLKKNEKGYGKRFLEFIEVSNAIKDTRKETKSMVILSYSVLIFTGILISSFIGISEISFLIVMIVSTLVGLLFDLYLVPSLSKWSELKFYKGKAKNWKKDKNSSGDNDVLEEELVEGINY